MNKSLELGHIANLKQGNRDSFRFLYDHYFDRVYGFCLSFVGRSEVAEELAGDVFMILWRKRKTIYTDHILQPFLYKISRDLAWNHLRKISNQKSRWQEFIDIAARRKRVNQSIYFDQQAQSSLETAIENLPPQQAKVFRLRFLRGLELNQIAEELSISKNTVKVHLAKSKRQVQGCLRNEMI